MDHAGNDFRDRLSACRRAFNRGRGTRAGDAQFRRGRWHFFERRLAREIGRRMLDRRHGQRFSIGGRLSGRGQRGIFGIQPTKQKAAFIRVRRNQADAAGRWQQSDGRRIDDLKKVKSQSMNGERPEQKSRDCPSAPARFFPAKDQVVRGSRWGIHLGRVVAKATEVIPCSSDKFVTSTTNA